jgi:outer membrane protein assembly factor BamB
MALDAATGKLLWQVPYSPAYVMLYAVNRGVGLANGKVFVATVDCRIIALDAGTGKSIMERAGLPRNRQQLLFDGRVHL